MKTKILSLVSASLFAALSFTACKKDDKTPGSAGGSTGYSKEKIAGTYRLTALSTTINNSPVNILDSWEDCEKDDLYIFNADQTYESEDAGETCADPNADSGTWSVSGNKLTVSTGVFTIESYQSNEMKLSGEMTLEGKSYPIYATYVKQ